MKTTICLNYFQHVTNEMPLRGIIKVAVLLAEGCFGTGG
jgi:hypothetical protein